MNSQDIIKKVEKIPSYILEDDIRLYHKYMSALPDNALVVDVGTGLGKSVVAMGLANPKVTIYTFDNGLYPLGRNWAKTLGEYRDYVVTLFQFYGLDKVEFFLEDFLKHDFSIFPIDLFHLDGEKDVEEGLLEYIFPFVKSGGIILARNVDRYSDKGLEFLKNYTKTIEQMGKIRVVEKL